MNENLKFHSPRTQLAVEKWPAGRERVTAYFVIARDTQRGLEFCYRVTTGKQRQSPRAATVRVVRGSDGRHYVVGQTKRGKCFVMKGTMRELKWLEFDNQLTDSIREVLK